MLRCVRTEFHPKCKSASASISTRQSLQIPVYCSAAGSCILSLLEASSTGSAAVLKELAEQLLQDPQHCTVPLLPVHCCLF